MAHKRSSNFFSKAGLTGILFMLFGGTVVSKSLTSTLPKSRIIQVDKNNSVEQKILIRQEGKYISGTVWDEYGELLPGVTVFLKGNSKGILTNLNGEFTFPIDLKIGDVLIFSFIGFVSVEYVIKKDTSTEIALEMVMDQCTLMGELSVEELYVSKTSGIRKVWTKVKGLF